MKRVALTFRHGLGDAAQFCHVLSHLRHHRPDWQITVYSQRGKHSLFHGLCHASHGVVNDGDMKRTTQEMKDSGEFDDVRNICWHECWTDYRDTPSTKTAKSLREVFGITLERDLLSRFDFDTPVDLAAEPDPAQRAASALNDITGWRISWGTWPVVAIHYEANTGWDRKNVDHETIDELCSQIITTNHVPLILDWDNRSPVANRSDVFCFRADHPLWKGYGTGDGETLAALLSGCKLVVAVDSGPLHVAQLLDVPTLGVWREHFPGQFLDPSPNVLNLVPEDWRTKGIADRPKAAEYFKANYRFETYRALSNALIPIVIRELGVCSMDSEWVRAFGYHVRRNNYEQDLTIIRDVDFEDCYKLDLIPGVVENADLIIDVGACVGAFVKRVRRLNPDRAVIKCVEACPENVPTLKRNVEGQVEVFEGACTYETGELMLLNAVHDNCESTGGSIVIPKSARDDQQPWWNAGYAYTPDERPMPQFTLEQLSGGRFVDLLKLDCEGSEYSILAGCDLSRVGFIVGEYHDPTRWFAFRDEHFSGWDYGAMYDGENGGLFHLRNPNPRRD